MANTRLGFRLEGCVCGEEICVFGCVGWQGEGADVNECMGKSEQNLTW